MNVDHERPWMTTASGQIVYLDNPDPASIRITDIALHLARLPRFCGATLRDHSVAAHSLLVADILADHDHAPATVLHGLLHDAHEAFLGDIISPVAMMLRIETHPGRGCLDPLKAAKERLDRSIARALALAPLAAAEAEAVKTADMVALRTEWRDLMFGPCPIDRPQMSVRSVRTMSSDVAAEVFMKRYRALKDKLLESEEVGS